MVELAYMRVFLAWETFLEEAFILYMTGATAPRVRAPRRYVLPPSRVWAEKAVTEGKEYAKWDAQNVASRALRYFADGRPFTDLLRGNQTLFDEAAKIRNAVAHESKNARAKFETVVRSKLGALPPNVTVGGFLCTPVPGALPPEVFLDFYVSRIAFVSERIVRL